MKLKPTEIIKAINKLAGSKVTGQLDTDKISQFVKQLLEEAKRCRK